MECLALQQAAAVNHPKVKPFLEVRIRLVEPEADLLGLCAGYEAGAWRSDAFAKALIRNLPQFALPIEEWGTFNTSTGVEQLSRAARTIYTTSKYQRRGEVGELILFAVMREHYGSEPIISKFYFKSAANETVKGFDAVHVVSGESGPELWLGEAKFYTRLAAAIRDVVAELHEHTAIDFLRDEFMWIQHKSAGGTVHAHELAHLLDDSTSLDDVFKAMHIPVLLTYKSTTVGRHHTVDDEYLNAIMKECSVHFNTFRAKRLPEKIKIHLILVPLAGKARLLYAFDTRLKALQELK